MICPNCKSTIKTTLLSDIKNFHSHYVCPNCSIKFKHKRTWKTTIFEVIYVVIIISGFFLIDIFIEDKKGFDYIDIIWLIFSVLIFSFIYTKISKYFETEIYESSFINKVINSIAIILFLLVIAKDLFSVPTERFAQLWWHLTNESTFETDNLIIKVPIGWIYEDSDKQVIFIGDYRNNGTLQEVVLDDTSENISYSPSIMTDENICDKSDQFTASFNTTKHIFNLYGCTSLVKYDKNSAAIIVDSNHKVYFLIFGYKKDDNDNIRQLLEAVSIK